jgi:hypothetical protein
VRAKSAISFATSDPSASLSLSRSPRQTARAGAAAATSTRAAIAAVREEEIDLTIEYLNKGFFNLRLVRHLFGGLHRLTQIKFGQMVNSLIR